MNAKIIRSLLVATALYSFPSTLYATNALEDEFKIEMTKSGLTFPPTAGLSKAGVTNLFDKTLEFYGIAKNAASQQVVLQGELDLLNEADDTKVGTIANTVATAVAAKEAQRAQAALDLQAAQDELDLLKEADDTKVGTIANTVATAVAAKEAQRAQAALDLQAAQDELDLLKEADDTKVGTIAHSVATAIGSTGDLSLKLASQLAQKSEEMVALEKNYSLLAQRLQEMESAEEKTIAAGNLFFKETAENLPAGKYCFLDRSVFEHILLKTPSIAFILPDVYTLENLLEVPFEKVRIAYYNHREEVEYEFIENQTIILKQKNEKVTLDVMSSLVGSLNAVAQKYFLKTQK